MGAKAILELAGGSALFILGPVLTNTHAGFETFSGNSDFWRLAFMAVGAGMFLCGIVAYKRSIN